ncbi:hypothetical protein TNCT_93061 [Trichonephila clavata]|uniref:Uncharacterized protein n=1 Tax=Trichonephila clavata TaxID=2740835 RepID=A0A8X6J6Z8_TRICU|nr:hypothetical protein TNCT_93061 [Trichonephila clavata]
MRIGGRRLPLGSNTAFKLSLEEFIKNLLLHQYMQPNVFSSQRDELASQDLLRGHSVLLYLVCGVPSSFLPRNLGHGISQV